MDLLEGMDKLRCLQNWGFLEFQDSYDTFSSLQAMDCPPEEIDITSLPFLRFLQYMLMSLECYRRCLYTEGLDFIEKADSLEYNNFMIKYEKCFKHLSKASRVFLLDKLDMKRAAKILINELNDETYSDIDEAGFLYLKSSLSIRYGPEGSQSCIAWLNNALEIVEDEPFFHNTIGMILSRIRHYEYDYGPPSHEELYHLRKALYYDCDNPWFAIDLARSYMDLADKSPPNEKSVIGNLAINLFREALQHCELLSGGNVARCVYFIMKRERHSDLEKFALIAKRKSNSILVNHYIGVYYLRNNKLEEALSCFEIACKTLPFLVGLTLLLKYRINNDYINEEAIDNFLSEAETWFQDRKGLRALYIVVSEFYLLVMEDFKKATVFFGMALDENFDLKQERRLTLTKSFKGTDFIQIMLKQFFHYNGTDPEIIKVKTLVFNMVKEQEIKYGFTPPLKRIINSLY